MSDLREFLFPSKHPRLRTIFVTIGIVAAIWNKSVKPLFWTYGYMLATMEAIKYLEPAEPIPQKQEYKPKDPWLELIYGRGSSGARPTVIPTELERIYNARGYAGVDPNVKDSDGLLNERAAVGPDKFVIRNY